MSHTVMTTQGIAFDPFTDSHSVGYTVHTPEGDERTVRLVPSGSHGVNTEDPARAYVFLSIEGEGEAGVEPASTFFTLFHPNPPAPGVASQTFTAVDLEIALLAAMEDYSVEGSLSERDVGSWAVKVAEQILAGKTPNTVPPTCPNCEEEIDSDDVHADAEMCGSCHHNARRSG